MQETSPWTEGTGTPTALVDTPTIDAIAIPELGNTGYLITSESQSVAIDAPRMVDRFVDLADRRGSRITHVLDTHVHNDFVSGARELQARTGATVAAPRGGDYTFAHEPLTEGDELRIGSARIVALETPGHTPEHLSYLVFSEGVTDPIAVLTGGSLLVGNAGRSDLLGPGRTTMLNLSQFASLRRLADLPGTVRVLPTHGAGSFCVSIGSSAWERTSTIEQERLSNPLLAIDSEAAFLKARGEGLLPVPAYYAHMAPLNRGGPPSLRPTPPSEITPAQTAMLADEGAWVLDTRDRSEFCAAHVPGSVNVELDGSLPSRAGSVIPFNAPLVLVVDPEDEATIWRATVGLSLVGYDRLLGYMDGGIDAWRASGMPTASLEASTPDDLWEALQGNDPPFVLDVRMPIEWQEGLVFDDATLMYFGQILARIGELPKDREIWTICSVGKRATIAASLLQREGLTSRPVATGGALDLLEHLMDERG